MICDIGLFNQTGGYIVMEDLETLSFYVEETKRILQMLRLFVGIFTWT